MFASLEVILVVLVQHIPALTPKPSYGDTPPAGEVSVTEEASHLISAALLCMPMLPTLCSPAG